MCSFYFLVTMSHEKLGGGPKYGHLAKRLYSGQLLKNCIIYVGKKCAKQRSYSISKVWEN